MPAVPDYLDTGVQEGPYNKVYGSCSRALELETVRTLYKSHDRYPAVSSINTYMFGTPLSSPMTHLEAKKRIATLRILERWQHFGTNQSSLLLCQISNEVK